MTEKNLSGGQLTAYCDGGSRGNPGPAGYGVYLVDEAGAPVAELSEFLGTRTNNFAEYSALLAALGWAIENQASELRVVADSELMVKQMKGQYRVNSPDLRPLWEEAKRRTAKLGRFEIQHVLRGKNKQADRLANEAMDRGNGRTVKDLRTGSAAGATSPASSAAPAPRAGSTPHIAAPSPRAAGNPSVQGLPSEVTGFVKNGVVHLVEGELPEGTFVRILPARR